MAKYIDADALKQKIANSVAKITGKVTPDGLSALARRQNMIDKMPAADVEPVRKWIPCSERLPEPGVKVLIYKRWEGKVTHRVTFSIEFALVNHDGLWISPSEWDINGTAVAWIPLPEPPKMDGGSE
ncbi:MAG: DUF551 domain-containing protein [Lachnospiraceae bacterium]|nr:DUF551 domain-containing protein [Lachnospiraceae bacterium]